MVGLLMAVAVWLVSLAVAATWSLAALPSLLLPRHAGWVHLTLTLALDFWLTWSCLALALALWLAALAPLLTCQVGPPIPWPRVVGPLGGFRPLVHVVVLLA